MLLSIPYVFCAALANLVLFVTSTNTTSNPFPATNHSDNGKSLPSDGIQLTSGEWKRSLDKSSKDKIAKKIPTVKNSSNESKCFIFVTQTSTIVEPPCTQTIFTETTTPLVSICYIPKCITSSKQCQDERATVTEKLSVTCAVPPDIATTIYEIFCTKTCMETLKCSQTNYLTCTQTIQSTTTQSITCNISQTQTLHKTSTICKHMSTETLVLTSTKLHLISTSQTCTATSTTTRPVNTTCTCNVSVVAVKDSSSIEPKKVVVAIPRCKRNCHEIPWWMKSLQPKYDEAKGRAYKKQINEANRSGPSKCASPSRSKSALSSVTDESSKNKNDVKESSNSK